MPFGGAVVDLDQDRLGEIEAEGERNYHRRALAVGRWPHQRRHHQLPGLAVEDLLDGTAVQRLAVAHALDPPCGRRSLGRLLRSRRERPRRCRTANESDELASFQLIELHSVPASQGRITGYRIASDQSA